MRRFSGAESELSPDQLDPRQWPSVDTSTLSAEDMKKYRRRKRALDLYLTSDLTVAEILEKVDISRSELHRLSRRALSLALDGEPWGYYALLPGVRIRTYTRSTQTHKGKAGKFTQFLEKYPDIEDTLLAWALGKKKIHGKTIRGRHFKKIWKAFRSLCEESGIDASIEYPFTNRDGGQEAVRRYCRDVRKRNFVRGAAVEFGEQSGRLAGSTKTKWEKNTIPLRPYNQVQLDAHRIDGLFIIDIQGPDGEWYELPLSRMWLLVLLDCASRAELGYSISLEENYTIEDVLACIEHALTPWRPLIMPNERICYRPGSGFPSGIIAECAWRAFDALRCDNAYAQRSPWVQKQIIMHIANEVIINRGKHPRSDAILERFFKSFEELTFHNWPNTTGSSPNDPKRDHPEENARRFHIDYDDLHLAADLGGATYNAQPHDALNGRTPLDYLRYRVERKLDLVRKVSFRTEDNPLLFRDFKVRIRGSQKDGHLPYVQFKYAKYSNHTLIASPEMINTGAVLRVNLHDARYGELFDMLGKSYGRLLVEPRWRFRPHSLRTRSTIKALMRKGKIVADSASPVDDYQAFVEERAIKSKRDRNKLLKLQLEGSRNLNGPTVSNRRFKKNHQPSTRGWINIAHAYSK